MSGAIQILYEREHQRDVEKFGEAHDAQWVKGELLMAALCYLAYCLPKWIFNFSDIWPWKEEDWKPKSRIRNLVRAGALIAAEIDRLERMNDGNNH